MIRTRLWLPAAVLVTSLAAASDYQIKTPKILPPEEYPVRVTIGPVTVAADPYATDDKSFTAFDVKDLNSRGFFPVLVVVRNSSTNPITVRTREIVLVTAAGTTMYSHPAALVVQDVIKAGIKIPKVHSKDPATSTKAGSPLTDFTTKELANRAVEAGSVASGFLFFYTAEPKKNLFAGSTLRIPKIIDEGPRTPLGPFELRLDAALAPAAHK